MRCGQQHLAHVVMADRCKSGTRCADSRTSASSRCAWSKPAATSAMSTSGSQYSGSVPHFMLARPSPPSRPAAWSAASLAGRAAPTCCSAAAAAGVSGSRSMGRRPSAQLAAAAAAPPAQWMGGEGMGPHLVHAGRGGAWSLYRWLQAPGPAAWQALCCADLLVVTRHGGRHGHAAIAWRCPVGATHRQP